MLEKKSSSVKIEVIADYSEEATYTFYYKKEAEEEWKESGKSKDNIYTVDGLLTNELYNIKVKVETDNGSTEGEISIQTGEIPQQTITFGDVEWQGDETASVKVETSEKDYTLQYQVNSINEKWTNIENGGKITGLKLGDTVYARIWDGTNGSDYASASVEDKIAPKVTIAKGNITSNSIGVSVIASDSESGMASSLKYTYYIKQSNQADSSFVEKSTNSTSASYTFTDLIQGTSYDIKVEVTGDKAGNKGTGTLLKQVTGQVTSGNVEGAITFGGTTWSNNKASIKISTNTSYTIQYQVNNISGSWTSIANGETVSNLNYGDTVYAKLWDGNNAGDYASASVEDKILPQDASINLSGTSITTSGSVTATVTLADNQSGVNITGSKWIYNTTSSKMGTNESSYTGSFSSNSQQITLRATTPGTYYLHVLTKDIAGNKIETISMAITVTQLVTNITVSPTTLTLKEGETSKLTASITPTNATNKGVSWSSNDNIVATVSSSGLVTAKSAGNTTITVKANDGSNRSATCRVTVESASVPIEDTLKAGDYVYYVDGTGITRKCVVLYDSSSSYGIQIITMETVENITVGNQDDSSLDWQGKLDKAVNSYNNVINTLNDATSKYLNTAYASSVRCIGTVPNDPSYDEAGMHTMQVEGRIPEEYSGKLKNSDNNYQTDWRQMNSLNICNISENYW